jgi:phosphatidylglycerol---prolipoprotein diacylglyceryl transferase
MRRILFVWKGFEFYSYSVLLYFGLLAGILFGNFGAHYLRMDPFKIFVAQFALIPIGIIGARAIHAVSYWSVYSKALPRLFHFHRGGGDQFGTYVFTFAGSIFLLKLLGIPFWTFWDLNIIALLILMLITRFGCLLNGCCSGRPTSSRWGMKLPNSQGVKCNRVPMQLLEGGWVTIVIIASVFLWPHLNIQGSIFFIASAAYGLGRIVLDGFREDCSRLLGSITVHQCLYGVVMMVCAVSLILRALAF